jgi:4,5-DOPA dioxygenase extradiol
MDRRAAIKAALSVGAASLIGACRQADPNQRRTKMSAPNVSSGREMPSVFLAHGSPMLLDDKGWVEELAGWAHALPRPESILVISAHWVNKPIALGATRSVPLTYDFYGFPKHYYEVTYPAPGAPQLANRVRELLASKEIVTENTERGLDHGAYVPLVAMYPKADVPVLQVSIPSMDPRALVELGRTLAPLRKEGVLIIGSGFLTHNMHTLDFKGGAVPAWASEFDSWAADALTRRDVDVLLKYREVAPGVRMALPTHEHFVPVLATLGASVDRSESAKFPILGFTYGTFTKRSVQFG